MGPMYIETPYISNYIGPMYTETPDINSHMGPIDIAVFFFRVILL